MENATRPYVNLVDLSGLDPAHVEAALRSHAADLNAASVLPQGQRRVLAIDGKVLRGSFDAFHGGAAKQILSAFAAETALTIAHIEIDAKSNEIPAAQQLLAELDLTGRIVTLDALHCQNLAIAAASQVHLIVQLKANQNPCAIRSKLAAVKLRPARPARLPTGINATGTKHALLLSSTPMVSSPALPGGML